MTKPTGRPRGRPKTKEYVTLMARVPLDVADQAKRYASRKRHTMSEVLRDGLLVLLQEEDTYPSFVYDRKEGVSPARPALLSDIKEDTAAEPSILSDMKEDVGTPAAPTATRGRKRVSDSKAADTENLSDGTAADTPVPATNAAQPENLSDTKTERAPAPHRTRGTMRQRILTLLSGHQEGLSTEQIRGYLSPGKPLGDTLQGMRRHGVVKTQGNGRDMRYFVA